MFNKYSEWVRENKERVLELAENEAFTKGDYTIHHLREGGIFELSEWKNNSWTGRMAWVSITFYTLKELEAM